MATPLQSLASALQQSLSPNPAERRTAERDLDTLKTSPGFSHLALQLAQAETLENGSSVSPAIRQASALLFKNYIRAGWALVSRIDPSIMLQPIIERCASSPFLSGTNDDGLALRLS